MNITGFTDYFINPAHFAERDVLRKSRLLVRACVLTSLFSTSYIYLSYVFGYEKGIYLMTFNVVGFLLIPFCLKTKLPIAIPGNVYVLVGASAIIILTYFSGGVWSAIYPWIISIPILALLVVGRVSGAIWGVLSFIAMLWFAYLAYEGVALPVEYDASQRTLWYISILPGLLLITLFIAFVFDYSKTRVLKELEVNNSLLIEKQSTIEEQSEELKTLIDEKDYIIRILAHDLRNPLKNMKSLTQLLSGEKDESFQQEYINRLDQSSNNALSLVNKILELDAASNAQKVEFEAVDVQQCLVALIDTFKQAADQKHIELTISNTSKSPLVWADKAYLILIFENLLSNAVKFSPNDSTVSVKITDYENQIRVTFSDQGPGIQDDEQDKLFQKFARLSNKPTAGESSTGLGLSLVKKYVELIDGKVWYDNHISNGATFVVELNKN